MVNPIKVDKSTTECQRSNDSAESLHIAKINTLKPDTSSYRKLKALITVFNNSKQNIERTSKKLQDNSVKAENKNLKSEVTQAKDNHQAATNKLVLYAQESLNALTIPNTPLQKKIEGIQSLNMLTTEVATDKFKLHLSYNKNKQSICLDSFIPHFLQSYTVQEIGNTISKINTMLKSANLQDWLSVEDAPYFHVSGKNIQAILLITAKTSPPEGASSQRHEFVINFNKDYDQDEKNYNQIFKNDHGIQGEFLQTFLPLLFKAQIEKDVSKLTINDKKVTSILYKEKNKKLVSIQLEHYTRMNHESINPSSFTQDIYIIHHYSQKKVEDFFAADVPVLDDDGWDSLIADIANKIGTKYKDVKREQDD